MNLKIIEAFCALMLGLQVMFFLLVQFQITDPWSFPALVFFVISLILCGVGAILGIGLCIMRKHQQHTVRSDTIVLFSCAYPRWDFSSLSMDGNRLI